ncbi:MarR family winged helix-turn-helix transcriptional regulator [Nocardia terpenica]|uniref:MarR family transcriptional regulator n=1 Tax=Nocardia terpenica TaxID=455432 RepID=A0A291RP64_9NOCA|nr:MarR family winged helix-turn-helix transcriptional regulator [Nocardia terpenica]ATL68974.1 MarR family transcriptional regulator [Nocardia terpenica]
MGSDTTHTGHQSALTTGEKELWRGFLRFSGNVISAVERDLFAATGLSGADFQILARLHESEDQRIGQKRLGELTGWTTTRLSHQLARMQTRGFVERSPAGRGRLMTISLTDTGRRTYESALPVHASSVRTHFLRHFDATAADTGLRFICDDEGFELDIKSRSQLRRTCGG